MLTGVTFSEDGSLPPAEYSDAGSLLEEVDSVDSSSWSDAVYLSELDQLSVDLVNRGPAESDLRLRYEIIRVFPLHSMCFHPRIQSCAFDIFPF